MNAEKFQDRSYRVSVDNISAGWNTRSYPHLIPDNSLSVADNVVFYRDGLVSKRPGNETYGYPTTLGGGLVGTGDPVLSMTRFYYGNPVVGTLLVQSGNSIYKGNDTTGVFTLIGSGVGSQPVSWAPMWNPDFPGGPLMGMFFTDGANIPFVTNGAGLHSVKTGVIGGVQFLPNDNITGAPITPRYCCVWGQSLVYASTPTEPQGMWISDPLDPERFTPVSFLSPSALTPYNAWYPGGRDGPLGSITGMATLGPYLLVFFQAGIVTCINTGTYGAFQFQFQRVSSSVGAKSPRSIVAFDTFVAFFGGDRFYATDGQTVEPLVDTIPTVYSPISLSNNPPLIKNPATVFAVRRSNLYITSYDALGAGVLNQIAVLDLAANGGYTFGGSYQTAAGAGGAWSRWPTGMNMGSAVECRGDGDVFQLYWGSSINDQVAQHDVGTYDDFGAAIAMEVRTKSFFFEHPINPKAVMRLYPLLVFDTRAPSYSSLSTPYVYLDAEQDSAVVQVVAMIVQTGTLYGAADYGTFVYASAGGVQQQSPVAYPAYPSLGRSVAFGIVENSKNPFNLIGFVAEYVEDPPTP